MQEVAKVYLHDDLISLFVLNLDGQQLHHVVRLNFADQQILCMFIKLLPSCNCCRQLSRNVINHFWSWYFCDTWLSGGLQAGVSIRQDQLLLLTTCT